MKGHIRIVSLYHIESVVVLDVAFFEKLFGLFLKKYFERKFPPIPTTASINAVDDVDDLPF